MPRPCPPTLDLSALVQDKADSEVDQVYPEKEGNDNIVGNATNKTGNAQGPTPATAKDMAAQITPTIIPNVEIQQESGPNVNMSVGSIDQNGTLLKLLHTKLGSSNGANTPAPNSATMAPNTSNVSGGNVQRGTEDDDLSSSGDALAMDESLSVSIESTSACSSMMSEVDPGNLTLSDGRMDKEMMSSLNFPSANISKSLEKSFAKMKKGIKKGRNASRSGTPVSSTPAPVSTIASRRRTSKRHADQKAKTDALLAELGL